MTVKVKPGRKGQQGRAFPKKRPTKREIEVVRTILPPRTKGRSGT